MTIKKSLLAVGTAGVVAFAGAGIASADEAPATGSTASSFEGSSETILDDLTAVYGSGTDGAFTPSAAVAALAAIGATGAAVAGSILVLPTLDGAIKDFQAWIGEYLPQ